ncbi:MAG TPA: YtxH domain-containing protein [Terriglobales bacterium]|jgi:gas vesicle protein
MKLGKYEFSDRSSVGTAITFLMIGVGAGALVALLLAPKSGKEMRRDIRRRYEDTKDAVEDFASEAKDRVDDVIERGADLVDAAREKAEPLRAAIRRK